MAVPPYDGGPNFQRIYRVRMADGSTRGPLNYWQIVDLVQDGTLNAASLLGLAARAAHLERGSMYHPSQPHELGPSNALARLPWARRSSDGRAGRCSGAPRHGSASLSLVDRAEGRDHLASDRGGEGADHVAGG